MSTFLELTPDLSPRPGGERLHPGPAFEQLTGRSCCYCFAYDYRAERFTYISTSIRRLLGYDKRAWKIGGMDALRRVVHPADQDCLQRVHLTIRRVLHETPAEARGSLNFVYPLRLLTADGRILHLSHHLALLHLAADGSPVSGFTLVSDVTAPRRRPVCRLEVHHRGPDGNRHLRSICLSTATD